ncbi:MAG: L-serine ammonia-lyase, iron-sulfur-dependent, subunit alpha [Clostridia bacterium]|nr:L-serine ammonia-lyase, iron-sulfur-dependent, subunit alpha [Clostridia bacterium]
MKSLKELYRIGRGPSSSHTMAPESAAKLFSAHFSEADSFRVVLYGSLASTGIGHGTDAVLKKTFPAPTEVIFDAETVQEKTNTFDMYAQKDGVEIGHWRAYSLGGGAISIDGQNDIETPDVYPLHNFDDIKNFCLEHDLRIPDYVELCEGKEIWDYLETIWQQMKTTIKEGLLTSGIISGGLNISRKARYLFRQHHIDESSETRENRIVCAYAYAVSEQNADGEVIVTAPTCGASGVLPSVLQYMQEKHKFCDEKIIRALATAGLIGNVVKTNASISGAECGCQAEIGTACSMASAGLAELFEMELDQIEYAAEVAMEHHLGLTCDPVLGLVQIPCIERNAVAAMRAINALSLANFLTNTRKVSFDIIVETMYQTGKDLGRIYRETSEGGLAKLYKINNNN